MISYYRYVKDAVGTREGGQITFERRTKFINAVRALINVLRKQMYQD